jgi:putative membrane protein
MRPRKQGTGSLNGYARAGTLVATLLGLAVALWAFGSTGFDGVIAIVRRLGVGGFLVFCFYSLGVFVVLGAAWLTAAPGEPAARLGLFSWGRLIRESVSDLLPFAQIGGIIVATRTLAAHGVPSARVYASMIADMTTELASQLVFTLFGLAIMGSILLGEGANGLRPLVFGGTLAMAMIAILFLIGQRWVLRMAAGLAGRMLPASAGRVRGVDAELAHIYQRRGRVAGAFVLNLGAWVASATGGWIVLRLVGNTLSFWSVMSLESLIFTLRSVAFFVPGALGVQEAAYALAAPLFGLPAETALALSLAKRARDVALGLPSLLVWQIGEMRAVVGRTR